MLQKLIFVLAITVSLMDNLEGSSAICKEKEKSLAALDLAKESISKAKDLYPNCNDADDASNSTECGKRDKSLGYIDVALNLISDARDNFPVCPPPPIVRLHQRPIDCSEVLENGQNASGVYSIWPRSRVSDGKPLRVLCDMRTDGGGWTVIQKRGNFSIQENFTRNWKDYKTGFGNLSREFWIGNDNIYALSHQGIYSVRFDMKDMVGRSAFALYQNFWIEDEYSNYKLHLGEFSGNAGDSMTYHSGSMFSTIDRKNDNHTSSCAQLRKSGYWFHKCSYCNPNGLYRPGAKNDTVNFYWSTFRGFDSLLSMEIKLKRL